MNIIDIIKKKRIFQFGGVTTESVPGVSTYTPTQLTPRVQKFIPDNKYFQITAPKKPDIPSLDKETLNKLAGEGHTNAVNEIVGNATKAEVMLRQKMSEDPYFLKTNQGQSYLKAMTIDPAMINQLKMDYKNTENATKIVASNEASSAYSMNSAGNLLVKTQDGKYGYISPQEYMRDKSKYKFMTNAQTLTAKNDDPQFIFQDMSDAVTNTVGKDVLLKRLKEYTEKTGVSGYESTGEFVDDLRKFGSPEQALGFITSGGGNENNKQQISEALKSYRAMLNQAEKNTLMGDALNSSGTYEDALKRVDLEILSYFMKGTIDKTKRNQSIQYSGEYNKGMSVKVGGQKETLKPYSSLVAAFMGDNVHNQAGSVNLNDGQFNLKLAANNIPQETLTKDNKPAMVLGLNSSMIGNWNNASGNRPMLKADGTVLPDNIARQVALSNTGKASFVHHYPTDQNHKPLPLSQVQQMSEVDIKKRVDAGYVTSMMVFDGLIPDRKSWFGLRGTTIGQDIKGKELTDNDRKLAIDYYNQAIKANKENGIAIDDGSWNGDDITQAAFMIEMPKDQYGDPKNPSRRGIPNSLSLNRVQNLAADWDKAAGQPALVTQEFYDVTNQQEGKVGVQIDKNQVGNMWQQHSPF